MKYGDVVISTEGAYGIFEEKRGDHIVVWSYWSDGWSPYTFKFVKWTKVPGYEDLTWKEKRKLIRVLIKLK